MQGHRFLRNNVRQGKVYTCTECQNIAVLKGFVLLFPSAELIKKAALLKRNCFASVFETYFDYQSSGSGGDKHAVINYRDDETM